MAAGEQGKSLKGGKACPCGGPKATGFSSEQGRGRPWQAAFGCMRFSGGDIAEPPHLHVHPVPQSPISAV